MNHPAIFLAADLGASSGRVMAGQWNGETFSLESLHRFPNAGVRAAGSLHWDALGIWWQIQEGMSKYRARFPGSPQGIGVDAWGVDFALLDRAGRLLGNPFHYRDARTDGLPRIAFERIAESQVFLETGVQTMQINTLFQLLSMARARDPQLELAKRLLMIPDLFLYFLSGEASNEYSEATTTQMYSAARGDWACELLDALEIPTGILASVVKPGTVLGPVQSDVVRDLGFSASFPAIAVASHDTASAVAAIPGLDESSAFISSGTWSLMGVEVPRPNTTPDALRLQLTNEGGAGGSTLLMRNLTGFWILQECQRQWEREGHSYGWDEIIAEASQATPHKSLFDPNAKEFQQPGDMPRIIYDYCRAHGECAPETVGEIARSAFESLSLSYRHVLASLEQASGRHLKTVRVAGGGTQNSFLCQMLADSCDRAVMSGPVEASALGNVMLQAVATGHLPSVSAGREAISASVQCARYDPHPNDAWDEAYSRYRNFL
jgi:rhamnulokinase